MMFANHPSAFRRIAAAMAFTFALINLPMGAAQAGMVATDQVVEQSAGAEAVEARETVGAFLARDDVRQELQAMGVDPSEAQARVASLSDAEAVDLANTIEEAPAGQGALGAIIGAGVFIFVVLLITDLLGFTSVFDFTNKGSANPS
ncbi:MAG: PA2779 family protein [Marivibrio sp.]|uniref:PA2779 family protein n=1 Tax=Marivibrio sp. TaxID=2039719 RepID=UPI0032ED458F